MMTSRLVLLEGFPGTGKSTVGRLLSRELSLPRVDVDGIMKRLKKSGNWKREAYEPVEEALDLAGTFAESFLDPGPGLILETGSFGDWLWSRVEAVRERGPEIDIFSFQLHCPLDICARRVEERRKRDPENYVLDERATLALRDRWEEVLARIQEAGGEK